jgi:2-keto-3-deoxy-L-rhamnonate aldolase RhmA
MNTLPPAEFRQRLLNRETLLGTMLTLPSPGVAELLAACGFDWLFIDGEHGPLGVSELLAILQAIAGRTTCLVRVPTGDGVAIQKVLDLGADGVIAPQINTAKQAAEVVRQARYAPLGNRGVGLARAHGYGFDFKDYLATANERISVVVQAEHIEAVENIEEIVRVPGIDAVLLGPYDLSASLGRAGQLEDAAVVAAIDRVISVCQQAQKPIGYFGVSAAAIQPLRERGCTLLVAGVDTLMLGTAARRLLAELKQDS